MNLKSVKNHISYTPGMFNIDSNVVIIIDDLL